MAEWYEKKTLGTVLDEAAARWSTREALTYDDQRWSFAHLQAEVDRTARAFIQLGIHPGDRVALWMPNRPEWLSTFFALAKLGAVVVPINTRFRTSDLAYVLWQSDATTLITVDRSGPVDYLAMVHQVCPDLASHDPDHLHAEHFPHLRRVVVLGAHPGPGTHRWEEVHGRGSSGLPRRVGAPSPTGRPGCDRAHPVHLGHHGLSQRRDAQPQYSAHGH